MSGRYELFEHMADVGIRGLGETPEEAFAQSVLALTAVVTTPERVEPRERVEIEIERDDGGDLALLFYAFLSEVIYQMASRQMLFSAAEVEIEDSRLRAILWGEPVDREKHQPAVEIKGPTLTELKVGRRDGDWFAQCILDI